MQIIISDDKKEKYQSVDAKFEDSDCELMGHHNVYIQGYGATEKEAKDNLFIQAQKLIASLNKLIAQ